MIAIASLSLNGIGPRPPAPGPFRLSWTCPGLIIAPWRVAAFIGPCAEYAPAMRLAIYLLMIGVFPCGALAAAPPGATDQVPHAKPSNGTAVSPAKPKRLPTFRHSCRIRGIAFSRDRM